MLKACKNWPVDVIRLFFVTPVGRDPVCSLTGRKMKTQLHGTDFEDISREYNHVNS